VQGYELNVLRGATETLRSCAYVYAECSEVPLYEGQALRSEVSQFLQLHGFAEQGGFNHSHHEGQLIQADYLFARVQMQPVNQTPQSRKPALANGRISEFQAAPVKTV
jgi:hypothetical protein